MVTAPYDLAKEILGFVNVPFDDNVRNSRFRIPISHLRRTAKNSTPLTQVLLESRRLLIDLMEDTFRSLPANPNKSLDVARFNATYAVGAARSSRGARGYESIASLLTDLIRKNDYVGFVGTRGVGKTALINKWLNDHTKTVFEEDLKLAWFRIDAEKVYDLQRNRRYARAKGTLENYFQMHSVYVVFRYGGVLTNGVGDSAQFDHVRTVLERTLSRTDFAQFNRCALTFRKYYATIANPEGPFVSERFVAMAFEEKNSDLFDSAMKAWRYIARILNNENIGILCIIDGIDNVSWSKEHKLYVQMCVDTHQFIENLQTITRNKKSKLLLVTRPETIPELEVMMKPFGSSAPIKPPLTFVCLDLISPDAKSILDRKVSAMIDDPQFAADRKMFEDRLAQIREAGAEIETSADLLASVKNVRAGHLRQIVTDMNRIYSYIRNAGGTVRYFPLTEDRVIDILYDGDLRSLLASFVMINRARSLAARQKIVGAEEPSRYLEYLLLGGKDFMESAPLARRNRYQQIPRGEVFPNIFWYDPIDAREKPHTWHGLAGYRMLQCAECMEGIAGGDLVYVLGKLFGYCHDVLLEHLEAFVAFGLLNVEFYEKREPVWSKDERERRYDSLIYISEKGRMIKTLSLSYIDWLYFLALDTPMHIVEVEDTKRVRFFVEPFPIEGRRYHFFDAYCPTVITIARYIIFYSNEEMERLRENFQGIRETFGDSLVKNVNVLLEWFKLPESFLKIAHSELTGAITARRAELSRGYSGEWVERHEQELRGTFGLS